MGGWINDRVKALRRGANDVYRPVSNYIDDNLFEPLGFKGGILGPADDWANNNLFGGNLTGGGLADLVRQVPGADNPSGGNGPPAPPPSAPGGIPALNIQEGVNPFADAARRAGFKDFASPSSPNSSTSPLATALRGGTNNG